MKNDITVLLVDDHALVRMGLSSLIEMSHGMRVVGEAENGLLALEEAQRLHPDVVIMDLMMPVMDGVLTTERLHELLPTVKVILLTSFGTSDGIAHALNAGASGAVLKNSAESELITAIRKVVEGGTYVSPAIQQLLQNDPPVPSLTKRQLEILDALVHGHTSKDIAAMFNLGFDSVNEHIAIIIHKLGAANRIEAVAIALRKHLLKF